MTLVASGNISVSDINTKTGVTSNTNKVLSWLNGNTKNMPEDTDYTVPQNKIAVCYGDQFAVDGVNKSTIAIIITKYTSSKIMTTPLKLIEYSLVKDDL